MIGQWARFVLHMVSLAVLARILDPADYGTLAMVMALVGVATILGDFGLSMASIQSQSLTAAQRNNLFWLNVALGLITAGTVFLLAEPIAIFYDRPELADVTRVLSLVFLLNASAAQFRAEATRKLRFKWLASTDVAAQAISLVAAVLAALAGAGYWALVVQQISLASTSLIFLVVAARWLPGLPQKRAQMRSLITFGANTMGIQAINYASSNVDSVLLGRFWGATQLGFYDRAYQLFRLPLQQIAAPMTRVALPILSKLNNTPSFDKYIERAQLLLAYLFGGMFFFAAAVSSPLIDILLGDNWGASKVLFSILAIGGLFQALGYVYYWIFLAKAMTGLQLRFTIWTRLLMIALIAVGTFFGPLGVAIASTSGLALNWAILSVFAVPRTGVNVGRLTLIAGRPMVIFAGMFAVVASTNLLLTGWNPWLQLLTLTFAAAVYLGLVYLLARPMRRDIGLIIDTARLMRK